MALPCPQSSNPREGRPVEAAEASAIADMQATMRTPARESFAAAWRNPSSRIDT